MLESRSATSRSHGVDSPARVASGQAHRSSRDRGLELELSGHSATVTSPAATRSRLHGQSRGPPAGPRAGGEPRPRGAAGPSVQAGLLSRPGPRTRPSRAPRPKRKALESQQLARASSLCERLVRG